MLSKEEILARTDKGLNVFKHYLQFPFRVGRNFLNPLYEDKKASCNVYFDRTSDQYKLKDYGNDNYSGDCFHFVGKILGTDCRHADSFMEILQKINHDLCLGMEDPSSNSFPSPNSSIPFFLSFGEDARKAGEVERVAEGRERSLSSTSPLSHMSSTSQILNPPLEPVRLLTEGWGGLTQTNQTVCH